ncbi:39S ribosomal protein L22, mitochondrial-like isoform X2 [Mercenaria mercenaria]|uniref:39S ribosomal protein L22, mitochondrial-like isoform X2 n=1 Tax=Mercenaria mercenaria TaxID=6596 RepID=UPI00234EA0C6|nr:39S ribosomal protein L22, mitochondrial-like isoform X2 [Mercenaria mercenaria]
MAVAGFGALKQLTEILTRSNRIATCIIIQRRNFHITSCKRDKLYDPEESYRTKFGPKKGWLDYNDIVYAPTEEGEPPRPAEICHQRDNIMMSPKKFWYAACLVRGLSIDEAIKQCDFSKRLAPKIVKEVLLEAQEMAVHDFNVEFQSNLWIADSFVQEHFRYNNGIRRHARGKASKITLKFSTYCVRLREGQPPKHYYAPEPSGTEKLEEYIRGQRKRRILYSL